MPIRFHLSNAAVGVWWLTHGLARPDPHYEAFVNEAVDSGLSLLGESGKKAIYYYLEKDYSIKKDSMASNIQNLSEALDKTFGMGSVFLKTLILKKFYEKIGVPVPEKVEASSFVEQLADPRYERSSIT